MRSFTVEKATKTGSGINCSNGRYMSETASGAAKKAFSQICKQFKIKGAIKIWMRETTQGSNKKMYGYSVSKIYSPETISRSGITICYKYKTKIHAL